MLVFASPNGSASQAMRDFTIEAFRHGKAVGALNGGVDLLQGTSAAHGIRLAAPGGEESDHGVVTSRGGAGPGFFESFEEALAAGRHWDREPAIAIV